MSAQENETIGQDTVEQLRRQIERLGMELVQERTKGFLRRFVEAALLQPRYAPMSMLEEIDYLVRQLGQEREQLENMQVQAALERSQAQAELEAAHSRGFLRRLFGPRQWGQDEMERAREKIRGRIALILITALIIVIGLTFWYILRTSRNFGAVTTDDMITVIQMVGTTVLTPLVGLIGAVTGFYYGGQTAVQAASQGAQSAQTAAAQAASQAATQTAQRSPENENEATSGSATAEGTPRTTRGRASAERATRLASLAATEETSPQLRAEIEKLRSELRSENR